jgi:hypothetical protein
MACLRNLAIGVLSRAGSSTSPLPSATTLATPPDPSPPSDESDITTERRSPGVLETLARYARLLVSVPFNLRGGVGSPHKALAIKYPGRRPLARRLLTQPCVIH